MEMKPSMAPKGFGGDRRLRLFYSPRKQHHKSIESEELKPSLKLMKIVLQRKGAFLPFLPILASMGDVRAEFVICRKKLEKC